MADVTYNTTSFPALISTLKRLSSVQRSSSDNASSQTTAAESAQHDDRLLVLLAYKERDPAERSLWDMAQEIGLVFEEVDRVCGAGGAPVEIYLGRFTGDV
jgi:hypothetical protein